MKRKSFTLIELLIVLLVLAAIFTAGLNYIWDWFQDNIWNPFRRIFYPPTKVADPLAVSSGSFLFFIFKDENFSFINILRRISPNSRFG